MIRRNDFAACEKPVAAEDENIQLTRPAPSERSRRRGLSGFGVAVLVATFALGAFGPHDARGQSNGLQITPLAQGYSADNNVILHLKGPTDVLQTLLIFQPGAHTGWHTHPGPVVVIVQSGALTEIHSNGCRTVHPAGSVFFETGGEVHDAGNQTDGVTQVYATFMSPTGTQPLIPVSDPGRVCRKDKEKDQER